MRKKLNVLFKFRFTFDVKYEKKKNWLSILKNISETMYTKFIKSMSSYKNLPKAKTIFSPEYLFQMLVKASIFSI